MYYQAIYESPVGHLILVSTKTHLIQLALPNQRPKFNGQTIDPVTVIPLFTACRWLDWYFSGAGPEPEKPPIHTQGTAFQQQVWNLMRQIPWGQTRTYGEIAQQLCQIRGMEKMSCQAVGQAARANPIPILIPCHRITGAKGKLTGYAGGMELKEKLLKHEKIKPECLAKLSTIDT